MACCRCNRSGRCLNCKCVKSGSGCRSCLPLRLGNCENIVDTPLSEITDVTAAILPQVESNRSSSPTVCSSLSDSVSPSLEENRPVSDFVTP